MVAPHEIGPGAKIGRFIVEGQLGAGGMGVVYAAHDRELDRRIALKVLRGTDAADEDQRLRLLREGQAMARITHPNVITVHEAGIEGRLVFLAQELLDGGTLGSWLAEHPRPHEVLDRFMAAGRGLAAAHAAGLVHRDFKPDNVLLGLDGRVRVSDFGLARALDTPNERTTVPEVDATAHTIRDLGPSPMSPLTRTGTVMGTPRYMAPEQHKGEPADERSDQFSFCVALYEALYGAVPFAGKTSVALADAVIGGRIEPPPRGSAVPTRLRRILLRGLRTDPAERYPSMDALLAELAHDPGRRVRRIALIAGLVAIVAAAVIGGWVLRSQTGGDAVVAGRRTVAVLGFKNLSGRTADAWLSDALSARLTAELAATDDVRVTSAEVTQNARRDLQLADAESFSPETLQRVSEGLGADVIVTGSHLRAGDTVTLVAVVEDLRRHRTKRLEVKGTTGELETLANRLAPQIREALGIKARSEIKSAHSVLPRDPAAARSYVEGMAALRLYDFRTAKQHLAAATKREPDFAPGHIALAQAFEGLFDGEAARAAAERALATANALPIDQQLLVMGQAYERLGDRDKARDNFRRLFVMSPDQLEVGLALLRVQTPDEQLATITTLRKLPPPIGDDPRIDVFEASAELANGNVPRALEIAQRATTSARARHTSIVLADARASEGEARRAQGQLAEAAEAYDESRKLYEAAGDRLRMLRVIEALASLAFDRGQLDDAFDKLDTVGSLELQAGRKQRASIAFATGALALAQRGRLVEAEARLHDAQANTEQDELARAYADRAAAAIATARGDATTAIERAAGCAAGARAARPALAAACLQLQADMLAEQGNVAQARKLYEEGLGLARTTTSAREVDALELGLAQLDLDEATGDDEKVAAAAAVATKVMTLRTAAAARADLPTEVRASLVFARARLAQAESQQAFDTLAPIQSETIQPLRTRLRHKITLGQSHAAAGDPIEGRTLIDAALAEATAAGWPGLVLEARLARVEVMMTMAAPEAEDERVAVLAEATARGFGRVARLAETLAQR